MTTILCIGDLHLSDKPPSNCTDDYNDQLFGMLDEVVDIAGKRQVDAVVFAGDIFHSKIPMRTSHRTVQRMIGVVQSFRAPVYLVIGNHDIQQDRVESIHETQPFGVLLHSGARLLSGWAEDEYGELCDLPLYGVSWQQDWQNAGKAFTDWVMDPASAKNSLIVTHAPLYPVGQELPWENVPAPIVAGWMGNLGYCYYGHVHPCHGVFDTDGVVFCNQGALSRGSLHEEDISRIPAVTIWDSNRSGSEAFERVVLKSAPPASEVFRLAEHVAKTDYRDRLNVFLSAVGQTQVSVTSVESVLEEVRAMNLSVAEMSLAEEVLTAAIAGALK
jgi:DNA repair protein SbcD/Mre11